MFGKYRILSVLGTGSFSTVYLAEHLKLKIYRAIKRIPKCMALKSSFSLKADFLMEADLLKNLNHPGVPLIYDIDEDDDYIYMIEEYIQGESLDTFVLHQENISQELILELSIQLCDILDYLHHLSPYPILYQDLKPEHIILCGNHLKLIDFGIASFFTGSDKHFQIYGTDGYVAPEALAGQPATPSADIYGLGKILEFLAHAMNASPSPALTQIIRCATAATPDARYQTAAELKSALLNAQQQSCRSSSHLTRNIAVIGSRPGAGATHIAISIASTLEKLGTPTLYMSADDSDTLGAIAHANRACREQDGIFYYQYLRGIPDYGEGVSLLLPKNQCIVRDYGTHPVSLASLETMDHICFILNGGDWDIAHALSYGKQLALLSQTIFICNHGAKHAARKYAKMLGKRVYCFPPDENPYRVSSEKERLISSILHMKGGHRHFLF